MPRQAGISLQNKFVKGLITEATALSFPEDACTEANNCVFDYTGRVSRRLGFDTEADFTSQSVTVNDRSAYSDFSWTAVAGDGDISFLVVQSDNIIRFYNTSTSAEISGNLHSTTIDLNTFLAANSDLDPGEEICDFASGNGDLFVANPACDPFYVTYDPTTNEFSSTAITLQYRDFAGLDDGLAVDERPTADVTTTVYPNHVYNLINQGWGLTDALTQWDTARTDLPSNADYFELFRASVTDAFNDNALDAQDAGNRPAPKGHFILDVSRDNRQEVFEAEGYTNITSSDTFSQVDGSTGTIIGDFTTNTSAAFDGVLSSSTANSATKTPSASAYIGKNFGSSPKAINRIKVYSGNDAGFISGASPNVTISLYASNSAPANGTDGTLLGTTGSFADGSSALIKTITSNDTTTEYQYVWIYILPASGTNTLVVAELIIYTSSATVERPSTTAFYAGRAFYAGIESGTLANNIYFSQIIESKDQYGYCYQKNDPTSAIADLLPDDGGVIKIPEMGSIKKLYPYQSALLVYASNGIWLISGTSGSNFKANDYVVKRISSVGMNAPGSLISIRGLPAWWAEDGIYTVQFDPNYDSFTPTSISLSVIDRFYRDIPLFNKKFVKGTYDEVAQVAYWLYNDDDDLNEDYYKYNSILCLDARSKAFYPWDISGGPLVRGIQYIQPATREMTSKLKFLVHRNYNGSSASQTFGEILNDNYLDWEDEGTEVDYLSSFTSGYKLDGQTQKFFQPNYVFVFLEQEENASCFVQAKFDFTVSSAEGKWSTQQQIYNSSLTNRSINFRRLKMRGKGRALQLHFESETQKPFTIIGWSIWESTNSGL